MQKNLSKDTISFYRIKCVNPNIRSVRSSTRLHSRLCDIRQSLSSNMKDEDYVIDELKFNVADAMIESHPLRNK